MTFDPGIAPGAVLTSDQLRTLFRCSGQGGMRRSRATDTLVLISNHIKSIYDDRWLGSTFHYTGMGTEGDQSLAFMQNKTLAESEENDVSIHLFEVHHPQKYTYVGEVELESAPYPEQQADQHGVMRLAWMFPLKLTTGDTPELSQLEFKDIAEGRERRARRASDRDLELRASTGRETPGSRRVSTERFERDPWVAELAKRRAAGVCQLCDQPGPFRDPSGRPFLETHHIVWLSRGGPDTIANTVALCPNCHRRVHMLDLETDRQALQLRVQS